MWRYTDIRDSWKLLQASLLGSMLLVGTLFYINRLEGYPRSVFILDVLFTFLLCGGLRAFIRTIYLYRGKLQTGMFLDWSIYKGRRKGLTRVIVIGAGRAGAKLLREVIENPQLNYWVVGFLDDDPAKRHRSIHGVDVFGPVDQLSMVLDREGDISQVLIAAPTATGDEMRRIVEICKKTNVPYKTLPGMDALIQDKVIMQQLREVRYEDLLGREAVHLETESIRGILEGKVVLVTGAGGSIGSELVRHIVSFRPGLLVLFDAGEANLYAIQMELEHEYKFTSYKTVLGKIQDGVLANEIFQHYKPDIVFHAAAYKHVPMLELNPWEAVTTNVLGSKVIMEAALKAGTERFVLVSTDKAVRPANVMGASKLATEIMLQNMAGDTTKFMAVRFGNVVGSSGSVIPLFRRQIEHGGPVTVTHEDVTRYFMTIPEASQLILQAGAIGQGGEIFILDMGQPIKVLQMAEDLIRLSGKEPGKDIEIVITGLRPGEKLYEELITHGENIIETRHEKIMVLRTSLADFGVSSTEEFAAWVDGHVTRLTELARVHDGNGIRKELKAFIPEYLNGDEEQEAVL
jgi:FlaA1/EpsC-like NDP-sugar epimerase